MTSGEALVRAADDLAALGEVDVAIVRFSDGDIAPVALTIAHAHDLEILEVMRVPNQPKE